MATALPLLPMMQMMDMTPPVLRASTLAQAVWLPASVEPVLPLVLRQTAMALLQRESSVAQAVGLPASAQPVLRLFLRQTTMGLVTDLLRLGGGLCRWRWPCRWYNWCRGRTCRLRSSVRAAPPLRWGCLPASADPVLLLVLGLKFKALASDTSPMEQCMTAVALMGELVATDAPVSPLGLSDLYGSGIQGAGGMVGLMGTAEPVSPRAQRPTAFVLEACPAPLAPRAVTLALSVGMLLTVTPALPWDLGPTP